MHRLCTVSLLLVLAWAAPVLAQPAPAQSGPGHPGLPFGSNSRDCATCHLDWADGFNKPGAILLIDKPLKPAVAEEETCLGCHDGAIADDRKAVWLGQGHKTNVKPPDTMKVPERLPLQDGKVSCRTCHTAHANPDHEVLSNIIFLRMPNDAGQLCQQCHTDKNRGPDHGTHPLGPMKLPLPDVLAAAGARAGADNKTLSCQSCHRPHGSSQEHLLVMGTHSSELCLSCHGRIRPEMWQKDVAHAHPLNPPLVTDARRKAIHDMGTQVGPNDTMICLSCHKLHTGEPGQHLLADTLTDSQLCLRCHEDRKTVAGSKHDLRLTAPLEKNSRGQTAAQSGQCGACHSFHTYQRQPLATAADPDGLCMTCHADGKVAAKAGGTSFAHPITLSAKNLPANLPLKLNPGPGHADDKTLECLTCHNPHETKQPKFLRASRDDLCGTCHVTQKQNLASGHDFSQHPQARNGRSLTEADTGKCGFCHDVHHATGPAALWTATNTAPTSADDLCLQCHRAGGLGEKMPAFAFSHLTGPKATPTTRPSTGSTGSPQASSPQSGSGQGPATAALPLFDESAHRSATGFVACATCHDPHGNKQASKALLRVTTTASDLCLQCHADKRPLVSGPHDSKANATAWTALPVPQRGKEIKVNDPCLACHRPHSNDPASKLWAVTPVASNVGNDGVCIACHQERHWSETGDLSPGNMIHPRLLTPGSAPAIAAAASGLPLVYAPTIAAPTTAPTTAATTAPATAPATVSTTAPATAPAQSLPPLTLGPPAPRPPATEPAASPHGAVNNAIACKTCHDPHRDPQSLHLLRVSPGQSPQELCLTCHKDVAPLAHGMHRLDNPAMDALVPTPGRKDPSTGSGRGPAPGDADAPAVPLVAGPPAPRALSGPTCSPCHAVHAIEGSDRQLLWAARKSNYGNTEADQRCLGCHGPGGAAKQPKLFQHPDAAFASLKYATTQPIAKDAATLFSCTTCHLQHGSEVEGLAKLAAGADGDQFIRAARPMVRDDVTQNVCSICHGADARRVFLYYHQPEKRAVVKTITAAPSGNE